MRARVSPALVALATLSGCAQYQAFDSVEHLRGELARQVGRERAAQLAVPFELDETIRAHLTERLKPSGSEGRRAADIVDFVFHDFGLEYRLRPTRDARGTFAAREGNCLSFVNLFVGIARLNRLNAFYVEVEDAHRWRHAQGMVLSQGHIVAGMNVEGELRTYDFLPYATKSYRAFKPIDDRTAIAHFHNNVGAEALLDGDLERATRFVRDATEVAPAFAPARNNLGVCLARAGRSAEAEAAYRRGLELDPDDPALLTNLLRLYQGSGRLAETTALFERLEGLKISNPFYFLYRGQEALGRGDVEAALSFMAEALRRESELPEVHVGLAQAYLASGDLDRAGHHARRALKLDATDPEARRLLQLIAR